MAHVSGRLILSVPWHLRQSVRHGVLSGPDGTLQCSLKDADMIGAPTLGVYGFPIEKLVEGEVFDGWFDLLDLAHKPLKGTALRATLSFRQGASTLCKPFSAPLASPAVQCLHA